MKVATSLCAIILILSGCEKDGTQKTAPKEEQKPELIPVKAAILVPTLFVETSEYFGEIRAIREAALISHTGGIVRSLKVKDGERVSKGQKLCDIEGEKYGNLLEAAKIQGTIARGELERAKRHAEAGNYSELQLNQARQNLLNAQYQKIEAEKNWKAAHCVSPISGRVVSHSIEAHQHLPPGASTVDVADIQQLKINLDVPESDIEGIAKGNRADVLWKDTTTLEGKVYSLSQKIISSTKTFSVEVRLSNPKGQLKPGQTVRVRLEKKTWKDAIVVPSVAVMNFKNEHYVYVVSGGAARRVTVQKGPVNSRETLILQGLSGGDSLITSGYALVSEGQSVKVQ